MKHGVLAQRVFPALAVEVEDQRLAEWRDALARRVYRFGPLTSGEPLRLEALVHVEVKQVRFGLRHPAERVGVHPRELQKRVLRDACVEGKLERAQRLKIRFVDEITLVAAARG